jgi:hypothetical protein
MSTVAVDSKIGVRREETMKVAAREAKTKARIFQRWRRRTQR